MRVHGRDAVAAADDHRRRDSGMVVYQGSREDLVSRERNWEEGRKRRDWGEHHATIPIPDEIYNRTNGHGAS